MMGNRGTENRIVWLNIVKYIRIIMVMLSYLEVVTDVWHAFFPISLFAFFFVSGYVYKPKDKFYHPNDEGGMAWSDLEIGIV